MNIITDYVVITAVLYFFYTGWHKGFFKTLLGPLSLLIGCVIGFAHFQKTQNLIASLSIGIISPFIITILVSIALKLWHKAVKGDDVQVSLPSRLMGSLFSIFWGGGYLVMMLVLIAVVPLHFKWFEKIQNDVLVSKSYTFINGYINNFSNASLDIEKIIDVLQDPEKLRTYESTDEFQALQKDTRLNDLFDDEETAEQIRSQDYRKLLSNPKMQAVFQDKDLLKKIFALNKKIAEEDPGGNDSAEPKVIDILPE